MTVDGIFSGLGELLSGILETILSVLPDSPFQAIASNSAVSEVLSVLNWFVPVNQMISILQAWLVAVGIYYLWSVVLAWAKAIR